MRWFAILILATTFVADSAGADCSSFTLSGAGGGSGTGTGTGGGGGGGGDGEDDGDGELKLEIDENGRIVCTANCGSMGSPRFKYGAGGATR